MIGTLPRVLGLAVVFAAIPAFANPVITAEYDPGAGFTAADMAVIQSALNFYENNVADNFSLTIAFGASPGGGGSSVWSTDTVNYSDYYSALVGHSSGNATDTSAIASLGGGPQINNPVTGSAEIDLTTTLAALLGLGSQSSSSFAGCGGLTANACIAIGTDVLFGGPGGTPNGGLGGVIQHETDEVLGTASALPNGGGSVPTNPLAADLYRYSAPGTRGFALNTSTDVPCTGSPTAYLSVNGGTTNLNDYNNCNNGGDYGDWIGTDGLQVQDAFGPDDVAASLSPTSPEMTLLDAVGYNLTTTTAVPEPSTGLLMLGFLAMLPVAKIGLRRRP
jgi:hypothetical protein